MQVYLPGLAWTRDVSPDGAECDASVTFVVECDASVTFVIAAAAAVPGSRSSTLR
jgi:hypothetical protein